MIPTLFFLSFSFSLSLSLSLSLSQDQYFFIHEAVNEAIACGVTDVTSDQFPIHLDKLELIQDDGESSLLELEFKVQPLFFDICSHMQHVKHVKNHVTKCMHVHTHNVLLYYKCTCIICTDMIFYMYIVKLHVHLHVILSYTYMYMYAVFLQVKCVHVCTVHYVNMINGF